MYLVKLAETTYKRKPYGEITYSQFRKLLKLIKERPFFVKLDDRNRTNLLGSTIS